MNTFSVETQAPCLAYFGSETPQTYDLGPQSQVPNHTQHGYTGLCLMMGYVRYRAQGSPQERKPGWSVLIPLTQDMIPSIEVHSYYSRPNGANGVPVLMKSHDHWINETHAHAGGMANTGMHARTPKKHTHTRRHTHTHDD